MTVDGTWNLTLSTPMGDRPATAELKADGDTLTGAMVATQGRQEFEEGSVDGNEVTWTATVSGAMGEMKLEFAGTVEGDSMSGSVQFGSFGSGTFTGTREG